MSAQKSILCPVLIGRASQLESLTSLIHQTQGGKGSIALISGEAGIGKSRLLAEAKRIAQRTGSSILEGHCFESDRNIPYAPLVDLLRAFYTTRSSNEISQSIDSATSELVKLLPELAELLQNTITSPLSIEPEQEKRRIFESMVQFFFREAARTPLLIIIEDLHWSDDNSLDFLLYFVRRINTHPIALLLTVRSEEAHAKLNHFLALLNRDRYPLEIVLTHLQMDEVGVMIRAIFGIEQSVRADFLNALYRLTEGNPFFVEEVLKSLSAAGEFSNIDRQWDRKSLEELHIPLNIQDAVQQRVEQFDAKTRQILTMAAVIGQRFEFALLQAMTSTEEQELTQTLKKLVTAQLIAEESPDQFSFRHALTREAVYVSLLQREQQKYHRAIAEKLERMPARTTDRRTADLADHFYKGALWDKALEYSQQAGRQAQTLYAPAEAVEYFTQALNSAQKLEIVPPAILYRERGRAHEMLGSFENARTDYEHALRSARQARDGVAEWQSLIDLGFLSVGRDYKLAGRYLGDALALADQIADPILRARSLNRLGNWLLNTGRFAEGFQSHQEALIIFDEQHDIQGMAETHDLLGTAYGMQGDRVRAVEQLGKAIALFHTLNDTQSLLSSLAMRALQSMPGASETTFCPLRTRDECVRDAAEALQLARQIDSLTGQAFTGNALAHTLLSFGEFGEALSYAQAAQNIATEIDHHQWTAATYHCIGRIYLFLLQPASAETALKHGVKLAQELGSAFWATTLAANLGLAYILKHDLATAQATLQAVMPRGHQPQNIVEREIALAWGELSLAQGEAATALQIAEQLLGTIPGRMSGQPVPHLMKLKGESLMALSRLDEAVAALEEARRGAQERNAQPVLWTIHRSLGRAYQLLKRKDHAQQEWTVARQIITKLAMSVEDAFLRAQFEHAALSTLPREKPLRPGEAAKRAYAGLTAREREVAALVAKGKTSREIAELLVVSERTAEVHVSNILRKLSFSSRTQIAAWAVETGLAKQ